MARFYGTVAGGRGEASRLGHANTGLRTKAASWSGAVEVTMYAEGEEDHVRIVAAKHGNSGPDQAAGEIYDGPVTGLKEIVDFWQRRDQLRAAITLIGDGS